VTVIIEERSKHSDDYGPSVGETAGLAQAVQIVVYLCLQSRRFSLLIGFLGFARLDCQSKRISLHSLVSKASSLLSF